MGSVICVCVGFVMFWCVFMWVWNVWMCVGFVTYVCVCVFGFFNAWMFCMCGFYNV